MQQIKNITEPTLTVGVSNIFLPDSELQFALDARNLQPSRLRALQNRSNVATCASPKLLMKMKAKAMTQA